MYVGICESSLLCIVVHIVLSSFELISMRKPSFNDILAVMLIKELSS